MAVLGLFIAVVTVIVTLKSWTNKNISGGWKIKFNVEKSSYSPYIGETHVQKVFFIQNDCSITGDGEKTEYNNRALPSHQHRKLEYEGNVDGSTLIAKYVLHGERRISTGSINAHISDDGKTLAGTFTGTAGNSEGTISGQKLD